MGYAIEEVTLPDAEGVGIRETRPVEELPAFFESAFTELGQYVAEADPAALAGPPFARYFTAPPQAIDVEAVFPLTHALPPRGRVHEVHLAGGPAIQVLHEGPYAGMGAAYESIEGWLSEHGRSPSGPPREVYLTGPDETPQRTLVVQPIAP